MVPSDSHRVSTKKLKQSSIALFFNPPSIHKASQKEISPPPKWPDKNSSDLQGAHRISWSPESKNEKASSSTGVAIKQVHSEDSAAIQVDKLPSNFSSRLATSVPPPPSSPTLSVCPLDLRAPSQTPTPAQTAVPPEDSSSEILPQPPSYPSPTPVQPQPLLESTAKSTTSSTRPRKLHKRVQAPPEPTEAPLTDYEQQRLDRIGRNAEYMQSLGISTLIPQQPAPAAPPKSRPKARFTEPQGPVRRSTRLTSQPSDATPDVLAQHKSDGQDLAPQDAADLDAIASWDDSSVHTYLCSRNVDSAPDPRPPSRSEPDDFTASPHRQLLGFRTNNRELHDPALPRIYSVAVEAEKGLLAAGGHQGRIAVFAVPEVGEDGKQLGDGAEAPLLSWKAGRGWISQVHFLGEGGAGTLLLSSSNDRLLTLWDLAQQQAGGAPRQVASSDRLHSQGIFGMHEMGLQVATASKDRAVGLTRVGPTGLEGGRRLEGHHETAVRCVQFRDVHTVADGGADSMICLLDLRLPSPCILSLPNCHLSPINSVEWHPADPHLLLSASHDPTLVLHDIRSPSAPLHRLRGHMSPRVQRSSQIYRPAFVWGGRGVATPGEGSQQVSLYRVDSGKAVSRGHVGFDATTLTARWGGGGGGWWGRGWGWEGGLPVGGCGSDLRTETYLV